jgi:hypothetical protein
MLTFQGRENIKSIENYLFSFFPNLGLKNWQFMYIVGKYNILYKL